MTTLFLHVTKLSIPTVCTNVYSRRYIAEEYEPMIKTSATVQYITKARYQYIRSHFARLGLLPRGQKRGGKGVKTGGGGGGGEGG